MILRIEDNLQTSLLRIGEKPNSKFTKLIMQAQKRENIQTQNQMLSNITNR